MSELDKYDRYDPYARHSTHKKKSTTPPDIAEAWLQQHGNGLTKLPQEKLKMAGYWKLYGKIPTKNLVTDYFNHYDVLVPSDIQDTGCCQNILNMCNKLTRAGKLIKFAISKESINPGGGKKPQIASAFKQA